MFGAGNTPGTVQSDIRHLFDDNTSGGSLPSVPPGLQRSGSDLRPKANSVIGRPATNNLVSFYLFILAPKNGLFAATSKLFEPSSSNYARFDLYERQQKFFYD
jgi:hypothetical protein